MIKVLHIVTSLAATGVPTLLYSYYSRMDREKIQFDDHKKNREQERNSNAT